MSAFLKISLKNFSYTSYYPYVRVEKIEFTGNTLSLNLKNMSETPAFEIGLLVNFYPGSKLEKDGFLTFASAF